MSVAYKWVQWNKHKITYDLVLVAAILMYLAVFVGVGVAAFAAPGEISVPVLIMRGTSSLALILLHVILIIGPLSRLMPGALVLLYNRRHLGVAFFLVALAHSVVAIGYYGGFGVRDPVSAVVAGYLFASVSGLPFEWLGLAALLIFFVMAATSHDFWLVNLSHRVWKGIHMLVYPAYGLVLLHVVFGVLRSEPSLLYPVALATGAALVTGLHVWAGVREWRRDGARAGEPDSGWLDVGAPSSIVDACARVVRGPGGEAIAVFRDGDRFSAITNVCAHQGGPLGEGRIVEGCVTCPWHGYQYLAHNGQSPPPYTEKIPTYELRLRGGRLEVRTEALPPGTPVPPVVVPGLMLHVAGSASADTNRTGGRA